MECPLGETGAQGKLRAMIADTANNAVVIAADNDMPTLGLMPGIISGGPLARSYKQECVALTETKSFSGLGASSCSN